MRISSLGDNAVIVSFGDVISEELNLKSIVLCQKLTDDPFSGFIEAAPAYASASVFYDVMAVRKAYPEYRSASAAVASIVEQLCKRLSASDPIEMRPIEIPVSFDPVSALDLRDASALCGLSPDEFLNIFLGKTYRVFMLGFLPGFAYMGSVDERIAVPRRSKPRTKVPKGSVGVAGFQTGIYPRDSPGGWQLIGRTELELFDPNRSEPCVFRPGDEVRFVNIAK